MAYPTSLNTLGDHLRKVRLDRRLSQPQVAKMLKVTTDSITGWELNRYEPQARLASRVIQFLGYKPFPEEGLSLGKKLFFARLLSGMTQKQVASKIDCDESNLRYIELDKRTPGQMTLAKIQKFIASAYSDFG
ncbi:MAG: helix-turn-helix transcriptional regulator [Saprospiraceae bacterium]